ncbi:PDZ domain-containing protein [Alicyclobacillaceae bacterium I2511]|nr:PDZ domain-containing protein [Alicyclobacillaceae bacterium I2511]
MTVVAWGQVLRGTGVGLVWLLGNPLLYLGIFLAAWELRRQSRLEKRFFGIRLTRVWPTLAKREAVAVVLGGSLTVVLFVLGVVLPWWQIAVFTALSLLAAIGGWRWLSPAYSIALLVLFAGVAAAFPAAVGHTLLAVSFNQLRLVNAAAWSTLVGVNWLAEALLLWYYRHQEAPALVRSRRGKAVGAVVVQLSFITPVLVLQPGAGHWLSGLTPLWPWLGTSVGASGSPGGLAWLGVPLLLGFSGLTLSQPGIRLVRRMALTNGVAGGLVLAGGIAQAYFHGWYGGLGLLLAILMRTAVLIGQWHQDLQSDPLLGGHPQGVRVLAVHPGSLAEQLGLQVGAVITHVNQLPVHSLYDLHFALEQNSAYAKLQVNRIDGEPLLVGGSIFTGERNQLGLVILPDQDGIPSYVGRMGGLFATLQMPVVLVRVRDGQGLDKREDGTSHRTVVDDLTPDLPVRPPRGRHRRQQSHETTPL